MCRTSKRLLASSLAAGLLWIALATPASAQCVRDGEVAVSTNVSQFICENSPTNVPLAACCSGTSSPVWNPSTNKCDRVCDFKDRCVGIVCTPLNQCHFAGVCDPFTGFCSNPEKPDNSLCDDGNACTIADECLFGSCTPGSPATCKPSDACHLVGTCDPQTGCSNPLAPAGTPCGDTTPLGDCDAGDTCDDAGVCHTNLLDASHVCRNDAGECDVAETCDGTNPSCPPDAFEPAGTPCGDPTSNVCTQPDQCDDAGTCQPRDLACATTTTTPTTTATTTIIAGSTTTATTAMPPTSSTSSTTLPVQGACDHVTGLLHGICMINVALDGELCDGEPVPARFDRDVRARLNAVASKFDSAAVSDEPRRSRLLRGATRVLASLQRKTAAALRSRKPTKRISPACNDRIGGLVNALEAEIS